MKVLFLDVDGVLNKRENFNPAFNSGPYPVDDYCCLLAGRIQLSTDCSIVVSSSWRHSKEGMKAIRAKFLNVIGKTSTTRKHNGVRGDEIRDWLNKHPEVTRYAILDDDSDMLEEQLPHFFQTTFEDGLTDDIAKAVINHLNEVAV